MKYLPHLSVPNHKSLLDKNSLDAKDRRHFEKIEQATILERLAATHLELAIRLGYFRALSVFPSWDDGMPCMKNWRKRSTLNKLEIEKLFKGYPGAMPTLDLEKSRVVVFQCSLALDGERNFKDLCSHTHRNTSGLQPILQHIIERDPSSNLDLKDLNPWIAEAPSGDKLYYFHTPHPLPSGDLLTVPGVTVRCTGDFVPCPGAKRADLMEWKELKANSRYGGFSSIPLGLSAYVESNVASSVK